MGTKPAVYALAAALLAPAIDSGAADDPRAEYERRAAERYVTLFQSLDLNNDRTVSKAEAQADLNFAPVFDEIDINRDGVVTAAELQRFLEQRYGMRVEFRR
ncbi:MAG TPA: hypothetical protein VFB75_23895 [Burkholderiales bacterium]|nr:hypothetical protein [Burkholderiales bacterium]